MPDYGKSRYIRLIIINIIRKVPIVIIFLIFYNINAFSQDHTIWGNWTSWGDQHDGTYLNPIIPADFSDIDCIRVGNDFYAISITFQFSPGMVVLHSTDLENWRIGKMIH